MMYSYLKNYIELKLTYIKKMKMKQEAKEKKIHLLLYLTNYSFQQE